LKKVRSSDQLMLQRFSGILDCSLTWKDKVSRNFISLLYRKLSWCLDWSHAFFFCIML